MTQTRFCGIVKSERERRKEVKPMSRKNHKMIDGRLLQTDKKYSQLKKSRKKRLRNGCFRQPEIII